MIRLEDLPTPLRMNRALYLQSKSPDCEYAIPHAICEVCLKPIGTYMGKKPPICVRCLTGREHDHGPGGSFATAWQSAVYDGWLRWGS